MERGKSLGAGSENRTVPIGASGTQREPPRPECAGKGSDGSNGDGLNGSRTDPGGFGVGSKGRALQDFRGPAVHWAKLKTQTWPEIALLPQR